jgi:hypothetical protein
MDIAPLTSRRILRRRKEVGAGGQLLAALLIWPLMLS